MEVEEVWIKVKVKIKDKSYKILLMIWCNITEAVYLQEARLWPWQDLAGGADQGQDPGPLQQP